MNKTEMFHANLKRLVVAAHVEMLEEALAETMDLIGFLRGDKSEQIPLTVGIEIKN